MKNNMEIKEITSITIKFNYKKVFISSIMAGICISLGCLAKLIIGGLVGSILFGFGLYSIVLFQFDLFTGKAGYIKDLGMRYLGTVWLGNFVGCAAMAILSAFAHFSYISIPLNVDGLLPRAILCGLVMYLIVDSKNLLGVILGIPLFIMCGFAHSVAYMFYLISIGNIFSFESIMVLLLVSIGNVIGCNIIPVLQNWRDNT